MNGVIIVGDILPFKMWQPWDFFGAATQKSQDSPESSIL